MFKKIGGFGKKLVTGTVKGVVGTVKGVVTLPVKGMIKIFAKDGEEDTKAIKKQEDIMKEYKTLLQELGLLKKQLIKEDEKGFMQVVGKFHSIYLTSLDFGKHKWVIFYGYLMGHFIDKQ